MSSARAQLFAGTIFHRATGWRGDVFAVGTTDTPARTIRGVTTAASRQPDHRVDRPGSDSHCWSWGGSACLALLLLLTGSAAGAQAPEVEWRTLSTQNFRVHYPAPAEAWSRHLASRLEAYREIVLAKVDATSTTDAGDRNRGPGSLVIDVVVMDPEATANGTAYPLVGRPRTVVWTTPPRPGSELAEVSDWPEVLALHEVVHLVHLLRPGRHPLDRLASRLLPVQPLSWRTPRWAIEGYATYLEGELTGRGRPSSDLVAALLRRFAGAGRLPGYAGLSGDERRWLGGNMAYLGGAAFLDWLLREPPAAGQGDAALRAVWRRLTARSRRDFDGAFSGVFGAPPAERWDRFRAELAFRAITHERDEASRCGATLHAPGAGDDELAGRGALPEAPCSRGELWQDLAWTVAAPAVSPDGTMLATVQRHRDQPSRLMVWPTADDPAAISREAAARTALLAVDGADVLATRERPLAAGGGLRPSPREPLRTWSLRHGQELGAPRFLPDGGVVAVRFERDRDGRRRGDLVRFDPRTGAVAQLTSGAGLHEVEPVPDAAGGGTLIAVRIEWGASQLVRVQLPSPPESAGAAVIEPMTTPSVTTMLGVARVSRDGKRLAFLRHRSSVDDDAAPGAAMTSGSEVSTSADPGRGRWQVVTAELSPASAGPLATRVVATPPGFTPYGLAFAADGKSLLVSAGVAGRVDLYRLGLDGQLTPLVAGLGAALAPAPTPDGNAVFYLDFDADGHDIYRAALAPPPAALSPADQATVAAATVDPSSVGSLAPAGALNPGAAPATAPLPPPSVPIDYQAIALAPSRAYGLGRPELSWLLGSTVGPSGDGLELGLRVGDIVGRFDLVALGAVGSRSLPRGFGIAAAWRGLPFEVSGRLFGYREDGYTRRPERPGRPEHAAGDYAGFALGTRARVRRGPATGHGAVEILATRFEPLSRTGPLSFADAAASRQDLIVSGLTAGGALDLRYGRWVLRPRGALAVDWGEPSGAASNWRRERVAFELGLGWGYPTVSRQLTVELEAGRLDLGRFSGRLGDPGNPNATAMRPRSLDGLFVLGGGASSLRPAGLERGRVLVPAVAAGSLVGTRFTAARIGWMPLAPFGLPVELFASRYRLSGVETATSELRLLGLAIEVALAPLPLVAMPGVSLDLGVARCYDFPCRDQIEAWLGVVYRP